MSTRYDACQLVIGNNQTLDIRKHRNQSPSCMLAGVHVRLYTRFVFSRATDRCLSLALLKRLQLSPSSCLLRPVDQRASFLLVISPCLPVLRVVFCQPTQFHIHQLTLFSLCFLFSLVFLPRDCLICCCSPTVHYCRTLSLSGTSSDSRQREPVFESCAAVFNRGQLFHSTLLQFSLLYE